MRRKKTKIKNSGQATLFENSFLEFLTKAPAPVSATLYMIINVLLIYTGLKLQVVDSVLSGVVLFLFAMCFWTFFEYFFHRYINHLDEYFPHSEMAQKIAYTLHGNHHEYPRDRQRLVMPPVPGMMIVVGLYVLFRTILGPLVYIFMPGFMTGYLVYTYIHISTHKSTVPGYMKHLYRHHALHHYKYPEKAFGVSTTLWDRVFGTMPPEDE